jgi:hypothetical protein
MPDLGQVTPFIFLAVLAALLFGGRRQIATGADDQVANGALLLAVGTIFGVWLLLLFAGLIDF